jgi:hypothetical protein
MWQLTVVTFCCIVGAKLGGGDQLFIEAAKEFWAFSPKTVQDTTLLTCLKVLPVGVLLALITSLFAAKFLGLFGIYNNLETNIKPSLIENIKDSSLINYISFILFFEEGIFRFIPIIISYFFNTNIVGMLIIFNIAFALVHLGNFDTKNPLVVLPQFFCGIVVSICAFKFGFITGAIIHLYFDFVLFSTYRKMKYNSIIFITAIYYGFIGLVGLELSKDVWPELSSVLAWSGPISKDISLNYEQGIGVIMLTYGLVKSFGNLAGFDNVSSPISKEYSVEKLIGLAIVGTVINVVFSFLSSWLILNPLVNYPIIATLAFALMFVGFNKYSSLSEGAFHAFKVPVSALSLIIYAIAGPVVTIQLALTELLITLPDIFIWVNSEEI